MELDVVLDIVYQGLTINDISPKKGFIWYDDQIWPVQDIQLVGSGFLMNELKWATVIWGHRIIENRLQVDLSSKVTEP